MTRILTIIALLFATPAWAGEVDGKSFLCERQSKGNPSPSIAVYQKFYALKFEDGKAIKYGYHSRQPEGNEYFATDTSVGWALGSGGSFWYSMSRKTLTLRLESVDDRIARDIWQCKFMSLKNAQNVIDEYINSHKEKAREGNQF